MIAYSDSDYAEARSEALLFAKQIRRKPIKSSAWQICNLIYSNTYSFALVYSVIPHNRMHIRSKGFMI